MRKPDKDPIEDDRSALRWARVHAPGSFVPWTAVKLDEFKGRTVEVGGFAPYARMNPPIALADSLARGQEVFVRVLLHALPAIALRGVEVERVGDGVYRITAQVANDGYLPTLSGVGAMLGSPRKVRVDLTTKGQIRGGRAVQLLGAIPGSGGAQELTWVVVGAAGSSVTLTASSPAAGHSSRTVTLK